MRVLLALIIGAILGAAALWFYNHRQEPQVRSKTEQVENAAQSARDTVEEKLRSFHLGTNDIKNELARSGEVIRRTARNVGQAVADATADARITAAIKGKLLANRDLSGLSISVSTSDGIVTLSGTVPTAEDVSQAMLTALETDGVRQVISTIQVKPRATKD
ncbi:MAG TPA: BON domain-containing protein [Verrucomicrobiae bacterium]|nr:BON domain-containing protein [Verrucomicrobiae bacterium]